MLCHCTFNAVSRSNRRPARAGFPPRVCSQGSTPSCNQRALLCWGLSVFQCSRYIPLLGYSTLPLDTRVSLPCPRYVPPRHGATAAPAHGKTCPRNTLTQVLPSPVHRCSSVLPTGCTNIPINGLTHEKATPFPVAEPLHEHFSILSSIRKHSVISHTATFQSSGTRRHSSSLVSTPVEGTDCNLLQPRWSLAAPPGVPPRLSSLAGYRDPHQPHPAPSAPGRALSATQSPRSCLLFCCEQNHRLSQPRLKCIRRVRVWRDPKPFSSGDFVITIICPHRICGKSHHSVFISLLASSLVLPWCFQISAVDRQLCSSGWLALLFDNLVISGFTKPSSALKTLSQTRCFSHHTTALWQQSLCCIFSRFTVTVVSAARLREGPLLFIKIFGHQNSV